MGELISKLLSTNFATAISVLVAALALAFIYWIAIPAIRRSIELERELETVRAQLAQKETEPEINRVAEILSGISLLGDTMAMVKDTLMQVEGRLAASEQARTRGEEKNQEFYDHLNEVRQIMGTLSQRMMSLSTAVNQIANSRARGISEAGDKVRGLRS